VSTVWGIVGGGLALAFADAVLSNPAAESRLGQGATKVAQVVGDFIDPNVPGIKDRRKTAKTTDPSLGAGVGPTKPAPPGTTPGPTGGSGPGQPGGAPIQA